MKKLKNKAVLTRLTDVALALIVAVVFAVGFSSQSFTTVYTSAEIKAVYRGNVNEKNVSPMFNVYENTEVVNGIMDELKERGLKVTFFVGGCWADDNAETLKRMVAEGHEIANHGYFHKDHKNLSYEENKQEISLTSKMVESLCGYKITLFAPPSGSFSDVTLDAASDLGYKVIMWSSDTVDWRDKDENLIFSRATKNLSNGELVLMHPKAHTLKALPKILDFYAENGFSVVTVSENIN